MFVTDRSVQSAHAGYIPARKRIFSWPVGQIFETEVFHDNMVSSLMLISVVISRHLHFSNIWNSGMCMHIEGGELTGVASGNLNILMK